MMIMNQVTRAFTARKRRTKSIFRRQKTGTSTIDSNKVVEQKNDHCISLKKNHTFDDEEDIVSVTSNSSTTIDLTPCSSARCVITTTRAIDSSNRIPPVPICLMALQSDNDGEHNNNADDNNTVDTIPSLRRSTSIIDDKNDLDTTVCSYDDHDESDSESDDECDCDDGSCIYAPPPVPFICVPLDFSNEDALLQIQDSNCNINNNILLLNRPPTRIGDWDDHTIESNNNPDDDELLNNDNNKTISRTNGVVAVGTRTISSSMTLRMLADRHDTVRRHQAYLSSLSSHNNHTTFIKDRQSQRVILINNDDGQHKQHQEEAEEERHQQRQPRVVKWNMIR